MYYARKCIFQRIPCELEEVHCSWSWFSLRVSQEGKCKWNRCLNLMTFVIASHTAADKPLWKVLEILLPAWGVGQLWGCLGRRAALIEKVVLGHFWCLVPKGNLVFYGFICVDKITKAACSWEDNICSGVQPLLVKTLCSFIVFLNVTMIVKWALYRIFKIIVVALSLWS
jgi:hypothetical protein